MHHETNTHATRDWMDVLYFLRSELFLYSSQNGLHFPMHNMLILCRKKIARNISVLQNGISAMRKVLRSTQHTTHPPLVGFRLFALKCGRSGHETNVAYLELTCGKKCDSQTFAFNFFIYRLSSSLKTKSDSFCCPLSLFSCSAI